MNSRKIIWNLLLCLLAPITLQIGSLPKVYRAIVFQDYRYYDFQIKSLNEFLFAVYGSYFFFYFIALVFLLIPFQLIKDYLSKAGKNPTLFKRFLILLTLFVSYVLILGLFFMNLFTISPWYYNLIYPGLAITFSAVFTILAHLFIDRYEM